VFDPHRENEQTAERGAIFYFEWRFPQASQQCHPIDVSFSWGIGDTLQHDTSAKQRANQVDEDDSDYRRGMPSSS